MTEPRAERVSFTMPDGRTTEALVDRYVIRKCPTYDQSWVVFNHYRTVHSTHWTAVEAIATADRATRRARTTMRAIVWDA